MKVASYPILLFLPYKFPLFTCTFVFLKDILKKYLGHLIRILTMKWYG